MKRVKLLICFVFLSFAFGLTAQAIETDELWQKQEEHFNIDALEKAGGEYLGEANITQSMDINEMLANLMEEGKLTVQGAMKHAIRSFLLLLSVVLLFGLAESVWKGFSSGFPILAVASTLAITAIAVSDMFALVGMGRESMEHIQTFSKVLLPTVAAVTAASGAVSTAVAKQLATMLFSDFLITLINTVLIPLTFSYIAISVSYAAVGNEGLRRIGQFLKWMVHTMLGAVILSFVAYLNISGAISGNADAMTLKVAKFTVSNMVPVVGGILSDAMENVLAGASMLRGAIGVFGVFVILAICIIPFLHLGTHYLAYKATSALAATVAEARTVGLIDAIGSAFGMVLAMTASCAMLMMISMMSAISTMTG